MGRLISFLLVSTIVIAVPGPNILVIVSTSLVSGKVCGQQTVLGTTAMIVRLARAALGTTLLLSMLS